MGDSSSNKGNFTDTITGVRKFDGRRPGDFRGWYKKLAVVLGVTRRDIGNLIKGKTRPTEGSVGTGISHARRFTLRAQATLDQDITGYDRANEDLYGVFFLLTEAPASLLVLKHEDETGKSGNGQKALQELVAKYNKVTDEVIRATMQRLVNSSMEPGQDPDHYFKKKMLARSELEKTGEPISDRRFKDICVQGFTAEYKDIKLMMYRDPTFDIDQMQSTMRHLYLDDLSRNDRAKGAIAGRGIAMTAETSTCYDCGKQGHYARNCPKNKNKKATWKAGAKGAAGQTWWSVHEATSHNDEDCYEQGTPRPPKEQVAVNGGRDLHPNGGRFTMLVDSGASDHLVDHELIPRLRHSMRDYKRLKAPKTIVTAGKERVFATATGTIWGHIIDQAGRPVPVRISAMIVPGLGRNLFSPIKAIKSGVGTILETGNPHLQFGSNTSLPLNQHPEDKGSCSHDVSLHALGGTIETSSAPAAALAAHASNNTLEEVTVAETKRQRAQIQKRTPEEATITETERQRAPVQGRLHENASILQGENTSSTTAEASPTGAEVSSPGGGASWTGAQASSSGSAATSPGISTATSPGVAPSTSTGVAQDVPHHVTASTGSGTFAEGTFEVAYGKLPPAQLLMEREPQNKTPDRRAYFSYTDGGPCRVSQEDNEEIKISNGITGSPSQIGTTAFWIAGSTSSGITGAQAESKASHGINRVAGSSPSGTTGPSAESSSPGADGSTESASPGVASAAIEPHLRDKLNNETDRQKEEVHTLTTAEEQPWVNPEAEPASLTHEDRETGDIDSLRVHSKANLRLLLRGRRAINDGAKTQTLAAKSTVEAELMTAISSEGKEATYLSNFKTKLSLKYYATDNGPSTSDDVYNHKVEPPET